MTISTPSPAPHPRAFFLCLFSRHSQADMDKQRPFSRAYRSFYSAGREEGGIVVHLGSGAAAAATNGAEEALQRGAAGGVGGGGGVPLDVDEGGGGPADGIFEGEVGGYGCVFR